MSTVSSLTRALLALLALSVSIGASLANADEGLWTFERVPRDLIAARRSVTLDDAWLNHLQLASVRLTGGCSAVLVSAHGLMMTSRGCVEPCLADNTNSAAPISGATAFSAAA